MDYLTVLGQNTRPGPSRDFVVDEEHVSGLHFGDMPAEMTAISVYQVTAGKISKVMLLF